MTEGLPKTLGFRFALALLIGSTIGSGIFVRPAKVLELTGNSTWALAAWAMGGLLTLASGLALAETATQIPKTGGLFVYIDEVYGRFWGFAAGWTQALLYGPSVLGALGYFFAVLVKPYVGDTLSINQIAIGSVSFLTILNGIATSYGGWINNISNLGKFFPIVLVGIGGIWIGEAPIFGVHVPSDPETINFGAAVLATLWAFDGWMAPCFMGGEMSNPQKDLPKSIILGLALVTVAYMAVNLAMMKVIPANELATLGEGAAQAVATKLFGEFGGNMIAVAIAISIFGCLNGKIIGQSRVIYAMAERNQLPFSKALVGISQAGAPINAVLLQGFLAVLLLLFYDPQYLADLAIVLVEVALCASFFTIFKLRKINHGKKRPYSTPLYPLTPILAILGTTYIVVATVIDRPVECLLPVAFTVLGLPFYYRSQKEAA